MTDTEITYASEINRPDGVYIRVTITAPLDRPDVGELGEHAQMTAHRLDRQLTRQSQRDAERASSVIDAETHVPF